MREKDFVRGQAIVKGIDPVTGQMFARPETRPARRADRIIRVAIPEKRFCLGQTIQIRRMHAARAIAAQRIITLLIRKDQQNIGSLFIRTIQGASFMAW